MEMQKLSKSGNEATFRMIWFPNWYEWRIQALHLAENHWVIFVLSVIFWNCTIFRNITTESCQMMSSAPLAAYPTSLCNISLHDFPRCSSTSTWQWCASKRNQYLVNTTFSPHHSLSRFGSCLPTSPNFYLRICRDVYIPGQHSHFGCLKVLVITMRWCRHICIYLYLNRNVQAIIAMTSCSSEMKYK